jgi:hypothetical protein
MTSIQTYQGTIRHGRVQLTEAAELPEGTQVVVSVVDERDQAILLDPHIARRKANGWIVTYVGSVLAQQPLLQQVKGRLVWRFRAYLATQGHPLRGPVGFVDVDAYTGDVLAGENMAADIIANATAITRPLSSTES